MFRAALSRKTRGETIKDICGCIAASPAFGKNLQFGDELPKVKEEFFEGNIGYHLRKGLHYFSREDWLKLINFVNMHR